MKQTVLFLLSALWTGFTIQLCAQDMVINGGHENYIPFPSNSTPFDSCFRELAPAGIPTPPNFPSNPEGIGSACATPDHLCQSPRSGKAHGGYFHYSQSKFENPQYRLCEPIVPGERYEVIAWLRLGKGSGIACDQIGFRFTDWGYFSSSSNIMADPDLVTAKGAFFEKEDYERIALSWEASGPGDALVIGNFLSKGNPTGSGTKKLDAGGADYAYYHLDDVHVRPIPRLSGPDTVCSGQENMWYLANRPTCSGPPPITWQVNAPDTSFSLLADTLRIRLLQSASIAAMLPEDTLSMNVEVIPATDTFPYPAPMFLCPGDTLTLDAGVWETSFGHVWSTGETTPGIQVTEPGDFSVSFTDGTCLFERTISVSPLPTLITPLWPDTIFLCPGDTATLVSGNGSVFLWSVNQAPPVDTIRLTMPGKYMISSFPEPCLGEGVFTVYILDRSTSLLSRDRIPNLFTPNSDGVNDRFIIPDAKDASFFSLRIFSRWGQQVFESDDPGKGWDGTWQGENLPMDTYAYLLEVRDSLCSDSGIKSFRGEVVLLR